MEKLRVASSGNVGIGTTNPLSKLAVQGPFSVDQDGPYGGPLIVKRGSGDGATLATHNLRIDTWWGLGFGSTCGSSGCPSNANAKLVMDLRNGNFEIAGNAYKPGGGPWLASSDMRLKVVDGDYVKGLDAIAKLKPVRFHYKKDNSRGLPSDVEYIGFVAQDVMKVFPESVTKGGDGYYDFDMHPINVSLVNAVQELQAEIDALRKEHKAEMDLLRREVTNPTAAAPSETTSGSGLSALGSLLA